MKKKKEKNVANKPRTEVWTTQFGEEIRICDMDYSHLMNATRLLERKAVERCRHHNSEPAVWFGEGTDLLISKPMTVMGVLSEKPMYHCMRLELARRDKILEKATKENDHARIAKIMFPRNIDGRVPTQNLPSRVPARGERQDGGFLVRACDIAELLDGLADQH